MLDLYRDEASTRLVLCARVPSNHASSAYTFSAGPLAHPRNNQLASIEIRHREQVTEWEKSSGVDA